MMQELNEVVNKLQNNKSVSCDLIKVLLKLYLTAALNSGRTHGIVLISELGYQLIFRVLFVTLW
jgi:hypothetical protein